MTPEQRAEALRLADEFSRPFPEPGYSDLAAAAALLRELAAVPAEPVAYPLPDNLYPGSKDWLASDYAGRVGWLHTMYESKKSELDAMYALPHTAR